MDITLEHFLQQLQDKPDSIDFSDTMAVIEQNYDFSESEFRNGDLINAAGQNNGSCKLFAFAQIQDLTEIQTLACFGAYYRDDVLKNPHGDDHQNIRNFIKTGWSGIRFSSTALQPKT